MIKKCDVVKINHLLYEYETLSYKYISLKRCEIVNKVVFNLEFCENSYEENICISDDEIIYELHKKCIDATEKKISNILSELEKIGYDISKLRNLDRIRRKK